MELAPTGEPWTATVAWARPWHRPGQRRTSSAVADVRGERPAPAIAAVPDAVTDEAWREAHRDLAAARANPGTLEPDVDSRPAVLAQHRVHLAVIRERALAGRLELTTGQLETPVRTGI